MIPRALLGLALLAVASVFVGCGTQGSDRGGETPSKPGTGQSSGTPLRMSELDQRLADQLTGSPRPLQILLAMQSRASELEVAADLYAKSFDSLVEIHCKNDQCIVRRKTN
jgi:hypothetical protein